MHFFNDAYTELHGHVYWEFAIMTDGKITHILNDCVSTMEKYDYCLIGPADLHRFEKFQNEHSKHLNLCIADEAFKSLCDFINPDLYNEIVNRKLKITGKLKPDELDHACDIATRALLCQTDQFRQKDMFIASLFFEMMNIIINQLSVVDNSYPDWLKILLERLNSPDSINISVEDIIRLSGFSHTHLLRQFKKYMGVTITEYLTLKKLHYCCNLLENTNCTTLEISNMLGFSSLSHLNHIFKKQYGITPTEYKRKILSQGNY